MTQAMVFVAHAPLVTTELELHWTLSGAARRTSNSNDANGYYSALGISPCATIDQIKSAYRSALKRLHPDVGGDEELYRFIVQVADVLLNPKSKDEYDSTPDSHIYLGIIEREELARSGVFFELEEGNTEHIEECFSAWIDLVEQVSPAVGFRGRVTVKVVEGGRNPWGISSIGSHTFVLFQRGVEPNRLHALCAMIDWQKHLLKQGENTWP